jgi:hypothetical protein
MMNIHDKRMPWTCQITEKDQAWYDVYYRHPNEPPADGTAPFTATQACSANLSKEQVEKLVARDQILLSLLSVRVGTKRRRPIISKHLVHDVLLDEAKGDSASNLQATAAVSDDMSDLNSTKRSGIVVGAVAQIYTEDDNFGLSEPV